MIKIKSQIGKVKDEIITAEDLKIQSDFNVDDLDSISKTAVLLTIAGYNEVDEIEIFGEDISNIIEDYQKFLDCNLNFSASPREFSISAKYSPNLKQNPSDKTNDLDYDVVLLFSGGIDSVAGLLYCLDNNKKVLPVWVDFGQGNQRKEKEIVEDIAKKLKIQLREINIDLKKFVAKGEKRWKNGIVPARNLMLLSLVQTLSKNGSSKPIEFFLCASKDEYKSKNNDKSPYFYNSLSTIFSRLANKEIKVTSPFLLYNKAEIMSYWKRCWDNKFGITIKDTISCYEGNNCGKCKACCYRKINCLASGCEDNKSIANPFKDESGLLVKHYIKEFDNWGISRKVDFLIALEKEYDLLSQEIKDFYNFKQVKYKDLVNKRKEYLKEFVLK
jgi:7-cyano-7-deazaguanine synthase in queuosine biosynthesis